MQRPRVPKTGTIVHASEAAFLSAAPAPGIHAIQVGTEWIDVSYIDNGAAQTLVCFHSALTEQSPTLPVFSGRNVAALAGLNLISVADPALTKGDIDLAWFLGTRGLGVLRKRLSPIIHHLLNGRRAILFGSSGGGYAAVLYGQDFPGQTVVAVNPRLNLLSRPRAAVGAYLRVAHGAVGTTPAQRVRRAFVVDNLAELYRDGLPFDLHLLQNGGDVIYRDGQAEPFVRALHGDPRLHYVTDRYGDTHVPMPTELLVSHLRRIASIETAV